jgi:ribonuclease HI
MSCRIRVFKEEKTNNEMEYLGAIDAMEKCAREGTVITDSMLVANQLTGKYKVKAANLFALHQKALKLKTEKKLEVHWCPREENIAGWLLESRPAEDFDGKFEDAKRKVDIDV